MAEGGATEFSKGFMVIAASAGAGAIATVAGIYLVDKMRNAFATRPKMKLFHKHPFLSARCTWFISGECYHIMIMVFVLSQWLSQNIMVCLFCFRDLFNVCGSQ